MNSRLRLGLPFMFVALLGASAISLRGAEAEPRDKGLPGVQSVEVRPDGVEITTYKEHSGRLRKRFKLPALNESRTSFDVTIGEGEEAVHFWASIDGSGIPPKVVSSDPMAGLGNDQVPGMSTTYYKTCTSGFDRGPGGASWVDLQTSWNYDKSVTSNVQGTKQSYGFFPTYWKNFELWQSNVGQPWSYSDLTAELWEGIDWFAFQISSDHMWHQVDAWGNCTSYFDLWPFG